ncbi:hypothetical protein, partial [Streptomyces luteogriseus]|uniref:hypothetical protein n=1 Tax=Streptomyces luteogriseus TaxID=68233 RepID=UPI0038028FE8
MARLTGPASVLQAQLKQNRDLMASVQSRILADTVRSGLPSIMASVSAQIDPLVGFRSQLAEMARLTGPASVLQAQLKQNR